MYNTHSISRPAERFTFLRKVYTLLFFAIAAFVGLEYLWFQTPVAHHVLTLVQNVSWLLFMGGFMVVSWLASRIASGNYTTTSKYIGFGIYVAAQSLLFIPLLVIAQHSAGGDVLETAGVMTLLTFAVLTAIVFFTRADLTSWGRYLIWMGVLALGAIVCSAIFGFTLGIGFSVLMAGFAGLAILHDTSMILHHYHDEEYVGAALQLFASVALMFWYILRILSRR